MEYSSTQAVKHIRGNWGWVVLDCLSSIPIWSLISDRLKYLGSIFLKGQCLMDSWRTHKYNCHLSPSLQQVVPHAMGTAAPVRLERATVCVRDRSVCKTVYKHLRFFFFNVAENMSYRKNSKLHPKDTRSISHGPHQEERGICMNINSNVLHKKRILK